MSTTVDKGEVRPARVEAGQRWAARSLVGREYTLRAHPDVPGQFQRIYSNGDEGERSWTADEIMRGSDFLGYAPDSSPSTEGRPRVMGAKPKLWLLLAAVGYPISLSKPGDPTP